MTRNVPVLLWDISTSGGASNQQRLDSTIDTVWCISLNGTDSSGNVITATHVVIDNTGINASVYVDYGVFRYSVSPYTRKTFPILKNQNQITFTASAGAIPVTFTNFDPGLPDEVNQVATGSSGSGGGGGGSGVNNPTALSLTDKSVDISISGAMLVATNNSTGFIGGRADGAFKTAGKYYYEVQCSDSYFDIGVANSTASFGWLGSAAGGVGAFWYSGALWLDGVSSSVFAATSGPINVRVAVDCALELIWISTIGAYWNNSALADPETGVGGISYASIIGGVVPAYTIYNNGASGTWNFGQSTFLGTVPNGFESGWSL